MTWRANRRSPSLALVVALAAMSLPGFVPTTAAQTLRPASTVIPGSVGRTSLDVRATYRTGLRLAYGSRSFRVDSLATITNTSGGPIDRLEFNTAVARLGGLKLGTVQVDGRDVRGRVDDQTIIVPLGGVLPVGGRTVVRIAYASTLRTSLRGSSWLFTKANGIVNAYRWLPWISKATPFERPNHGDPFVTPTSPFVQVTVKTDRKLVIAMSGDLVSRSTDGLTQRFEARDVRDMTLTAAPDFKTRAATVGDTRIRYLYRSSTNATATLDAAVDAFRALERRLGDYPYPTFTVVQSAGGYGMESPRLIWIPYGVGSANLRYLVAHETAHQWFYGLVGNDQARQPFADEAAADFAARSVTGTKRGNRCSTGRLDRSIYGYTEACYYERIYIQGGNLLDTARRSMGSDLFWTAIRAYVATHRHQLVTNETLLDWLDERTPRNLGGSLFDSRFPSIY